VSATAQRWPEPVTFVGQVAFNLVITHVPIRRLRRGWLRSLGARIAPDAAIYLGTTVLGVTRLAVGDRSQIGPGCLLDGRGGLTIEHVVVVSGGSRIITADHDVHSVTFTVRHQAVVLGHHAFLGTEAMVLPGVSIGPGAVLAARAVATRDVPAQTIAAGVPARAIGARAQLPTYRLPASPRLY
jgi:maltose O-acetyltransferase